jgi:L-ribulose-5-phosphate 3-epimerase
MTFRPSRRSFLRTAPAAAVAAGAVPGVLARFAAAADEAKPAGGRKFRKAVKYRMINEGKTIREKFELIKSIGFEGVEVTAPGEVDKQEALEASKSTGIEIHGVINAGHWQTRLSDPDPAVRDKGLQGLLGALDEAKFYGASTVLLVPGKVTDPQNENFDQCWTRSKEQIDKALPKAKELGVHIAIEIVWNDFLTTPELMVKYIDQFNDPIVGCYLDPSNVLRYGKDTNTRGADWVRALGKRLLKFDFKGYSHAKGFKVNIGEGDEDWPDVLKALDEVGYKDPATGGPGWATSEVKPGDRAYLADVAARMDKVLGMA